MVRVRTPFLVLFVCQAVWASSYPPVPGAKATMVFNSSTNLQSQTFINVKPAAADLPMAPLTSNDRLQGPFVRIIRNPSLLRNSNNRPANAARPALMEVIPAGLKPYWDVVKAECSWFTAEESSVLLEFFEIIVNDRPEDFAAFETRFQETFGSGYGSFINNERSVLSWLISFGSINILRSIDLGTYTIPQALLDKSMQHFVETSTPRFVANVVAQCPFFLEQNIFKHISEKKNPAFPQLTIRDTRALNLAVMFSELRVIDITHIGALLPLLERGKEIPDLINLASGIAFYLGNPSFDAAFAFGCNRAQAIRSFKSALGKFFELCVPDFSKLSESDRFSIARLFIDSYNEVGLRRMLDMYPAMASAIGNYNNLLQVSLSASEHLNCAALLVERNPQAVIQTCNQQQSPFFQAVYLKRMDYFDLFYPTLLNNDAIPIYGKDAGVTPTGIVMVYGTPEMLHKLLEHFKRKGVDVDIRKNFELTLLFMDSRSQNELGPGQYRFGTLMAPEFWEYLLSLEGIEHGPSEKSELSLLDLATIDHNPEIVRRLLKDPRTEINRIATTGPLRGNCLRYVKGDLTVLKLLVEAGVDINTNIVELSKLANGPVSTNSTAYAYLKKCPMNSPEFLAYLETLNFANKN